MPVVIEMADEKKKQKPGSVEPGKVEPKNVKLTPEFHRRLKVVAAHVGREMSEIVMSELEDFLAREEAVMKGKK